jgi:hypothetical protein
MTVSAQDAHPYPIYNARFRLIVPLLDADGDPISPSSPDTELSQDLGTFADATNEATEIATSSGVVYVDLIATELDTKSTVVRVQSTGAKTTIAVLNPRRLPVLRTGTAQAGANSTITLDSSASAIDDYYVGCWVNITNDTPSNVLGQARVIIDYVGSTKVATIQGTWGTNPSSSSTFEILLPEGHPQFAQVDINALLGTAISTPATAGILDVNLKNIANATVSTSTAQLGVNAVQAGGTAWGSGAITAGSIAADAITAAKVADGTIDAATFAAGAINAAAIATDAIGASELAADAVTEIQSGLATSSALTTAQADLDDIQARLPAALTAGGNMKSDALALSGDTVAADNAEAFFDGTGYAGTNNVIPTVTTVNGLAAGVITATSIAADAITAAKIAADAIGASELAADAVTEIQSGLATGSALTTAQADLDDIQTRLPAALVSGRMDSSVGAMAANTLTASALAADAVTEIQAGLSTLSAANVNAEVVDALTVDLLADSVAADGTRPTIGQAIYELLQFLTEKSVSGTTVTVKKVDGSTSLMTFTLDSSTDPSSITRAS